MGDNDKDKEIEIEKKEKEQAKEQEKDKAKTKRHGKIIIGILLSILLFFLSCVLVVLMILRPGNTDIIVKKSSFASLIVDTEFAHYFLYQLNGLYFHEAEVDIFTLGDFVQSDAVSKEIRKIVLKYSRAFTSGNHDYIITTDEVYDIVIRLGPEFYKLFDHYMTESDYRHFAQTMDDILDFRSLSVEAIIEDLHLVSFIPYMHLFFWLVWIAGLLWCALVFFIFLYHRRGNLIAFLYAGIPVLLTGLTFLTIWIRFDVLRETLTNFTVFRLSMLGGGVLYLFMWYGIGFAVVGALAIAAYFVQNIKAVRTLLRIA